MVMRSHEGIVESLVSVVTNRSEQAMRVQLLSGGVDGYLKRYESVHLNTYVYSTDTLYEGSGPITALGFNSETGTLVGVFESSMAVIRTCNLHLPNIAFMNLAANLFVVVYTGMWAYDAGADHHVGTLKYTRWLSSKNVIAHCMMFHYFVRAHFLNLTRQHAYGCTKMLIADDETLRAWDTNSGEQSFTISNLHNGHPVSCLAVAQERYISCVCMCVLLLITYDALQK